MIAARQYNNFSASLNPSNSIPRAQPTATPTILPAISLTGSLMPIGSTLAVPLPSSIYNGISPSQASVLSSLVGDLQPTYTETNIFGFPSETATSVDGVFTGIFGTPSPMAPFGSNFEQSVQPTGTVISGIPVLSIGFPISVSQSDVTRTSDLPSVTNSLPLITTSTSFTTVSPTSHSSTSISSSSTSSSSSSSHSSSSSSITSVPAARATSTTPNVSTQQKSTLSSGAIAGITFASAAAVAILAFLLFLCLRNRRTSKPPSVYPEEAYLYDPPITPPSTLAQSAQSTQPWMRGNTAYRPTTQLPPGGAPMIPNSPPMNPNSPPMIPHSPPMRALTPDGYERVGLLGIPEGQQDMAMLGSWPSLRGRNSVSYRPLGTGRGYRLPPVHEDLQEAVDNDPRNPFRDQNVA